MIGKIIAAMAGKKVADRVGRSVGGPVGAALGYGLATRRFRRAAIAGTAVMGALALLKKRRTRNDHAQQSPMPRPRGETIEPAASGGMPMTNKDPMPVYPPHV